MENQDKIVKDIKDSIMKSRREHGKWETAINIFFGVTFGIVLACVFVGMNKYVCGLQLILWTFNGYLKGKRDERDKQREHAEKTILSCLEDIENGKAEIIAMEDKSEEE